MIPFDLEKFLAQEENLFFSIYVFAVCFIFRSSESANQQLFMPRK